MTADGIACHTLTRADELAALAATWDDLVVAAPRPSPFLLHGWLMEWLAHYGTDIEPQIHVAMRDGALVGALPLMVRRHWGLRVAYFLGDLGFGVQLADLLLADHGDTALAARLLQHAAAAGNACADLRTVPAAGPLAGATSRLRLVERLDAPVLDMSAGWAQVLHTRVPSGKRSDLRRLQRRLGEIGRLEATVARTPADLALALEEAFRLHDLRWANRVDGSDFGTERGRRFHRAALAALAARGTPRIVTLALDGRAIAFHYGFALRGRWYVHRLAFDPALARFSPGLLATLAALEAASAEGLTAVEFLGGGERYKLELAGAPTPLYEACGLATSPAGRAYVRARRGAIELRLRLKRSSTLQRWYAQRLAPARRAWARLGGAGARGTGVEVARS